MSSQRSFTTEEASFLRALRHTANARKRRLDQFIGELLAQEKKSKSTSSRIQPLRRETFAQRVGFHVERYAAPRGQKHGDDDTVVDVDDSSLQGKENTETTPLLIPKESHAAPFTIDPWIQMLGLYKTFLHQHGPTATALLQPAAMYGDVALGKWVAEQRLDFHEGLLANHQREQLQELGFQWESNASQEQTDWPHMYALLQAFRAEFARWPQPDALYRGTRIGKWVKGQQKLYEIGAMDPHRHRKLNALNFPWNQQETDWMSMLDLLREYHSSPGLGSCVVLPSTIYRGVPLGRWVSDQLQAIKDGSLAEKYRRLFKGIQIQYSTAPLTQEAPATTKNVSWNQYFNHLLAYRDELGTYFIPNGTVYNGVQLGDWVSEQVEAVRNGTIHPTNMKQLQQVGLSERHVQQHLPTQSDNHQELDRQPPQQGPTDDDSWKRMYQILLEYKSEIGTMFATREVVYKGMKLGQWVSDQLNAFSTGSLKTEHQQKLEDIGFAGTFRRIKLQLLSETGDRQLALPKNSLPEEPKDPWSQMWTVLLQYKREYGTALVPHNTHYKGLALGKWCSEQLAKFERGDLDFHQEKKLARVGYGPIFQKMKPARPQKGGGSKEEEAGRQQRLVPNITRQQPPLAPSPSCSKSLSQTLTSANETASENELGRKSMSQTQTSVNETASENELGTASAKPTNICSPLGRPQVHWKKMFDALVAFKEEHGNCQVPFSHVTDDGSTLGSWVRNQRVRRTNGALRPELEAQLTSIGFLWRVQAGPRKRPMPHQVWHLDQRWNDMFDRLVEYKMTHGTCQILTAGNYRGQPLGEWVRTQRKKYKEGSLRQDRLERLEGIGFIWKVAYAGPPCGTSEEGQRKLTAGKEAETDEFSDDEQSWIHHFELFKALRTSQGILNLQRSQHVGQSAEERIGSLEAIDRHGNDVVEEQKGFKDKNGTCIVRAKGSTLGEWVTTQRRKFKEGLLKKERVDKLEELGFIWEPGSERNPVVEADSVENGESDHEVESRNQPQRKPDPPTAGEAAPPLRPKPIHPGMLLAQEAPESILNGDTQWNLMLQRLMLYRNSTGDYLVPRSTTFMGSNLGEWVYMQRFKFEQGVLSNHHKQQLVAIGFVWDPSITMKDQVLLNMRLNNST